MDEIINFLKAYIWEAIALAGAPVVAAVLTQQVKLVCKRLRGHKPHWLLLDTLSASVCFGLAYASWFYKYEVHMPAAIIAVVVTVLHTYIVKWIFSRVKAINPQLGEELEEGVALDNYEDRTVMAHAKTLILGKRKDGEKK